MITELQIRETRSLVTDHCSTLVAACCRDVKQLAILSSVAHPEKQTQMARKITTTAHIVAERGKNDVMAFPDQEHRAQSANSALLVCGLSRK
eukprot:20784-Heterococcus_DN1.PRE.4